MFLSNKYLIHYTTLCKKARDRSVLEGYQEKHHVIPKSLGGSDDATNLVAFTAREHYISHLLLVRITEGVNKSKMINAWFRMSCQGSNPEYSFITSRRFERARIKFAESAGWATRGKTYEQIYGLEKAAELKQIRSTTKSSERKGKTWEDIFGIEKATELKLLRGRQAISWNTGRKHSDKTRKLIKEHAALRVYTKIHCVCGKQISTHNIVKHQSACQIFSQRKDI
jgi:hypothetical protein